MKNQTIKTLKSLKSILKKTLPEKIAKVLYSYEKFSTQSEPSDAKGFSAYHLALKSAIVHMDTLLKLTKWATDEHKDNSITGDNDLLKFLQEARAMKDNDDNINGNEEDNDEY